MVLSAKDCSSIPWNQPWEPVRSCHASKMRRWGPWARSVGLPEAPTAPKLDIWAVLVSLVLNPWGMAHPTLVCLGICACFDLFQPESHALIGCAFCLELRSVFPCSWSVFLALFHLHTNSYQHSWKWSVINPYHYVDVCISCVYAGVDGLNLVLKSRQQQYYIFNIKAIYR